MITRISIHEYETSKSIKVSDEQFQNLKLSRFFDVLPGDKRDEIKIKAAQYVGIFNTQSDLVISITPKIGHHSFFKMLILGDDEAHGHDISSMNCYSRPDESIWDFIASSILVELEQILNAGIKHHYVEEVDQLNFVRGQILYEDLFLSGSLTSSKLPCRFESYSPNYKINKNIRWALGILSSCTLSSSSKNRVIYFDALLSSIDSPHEFINIEKYELPVNYHKIYHLIRLISKNLVSNMHMLGFNGHGYFLDMNKVFEGFARNQLRTSLKRYGLNVLPKKFVKKNLCERVSLEPDILIQDHKTITHIMDVKYKEDWDYENGDVFQMLAYLEGFKTSTKAYIIYPTKKDELIFSDPIPFPRSGDIIKIGVPSSRLFELSLWEELCRQMVHVKVKLIA